MVLNIWHIQKVHTNIAQYANDGRIQNLTTEKSDKGFIGKTHGMDDKIRMLGIKNCVGEHFCLGNESLFICHQIDRNNGTDQKVFDKYQRTKHACGKLLQNFFELGQKLDIHPGFHFRGIAVEKINGCGAKLRIIL